MSERLLKRWEVFEVHQKLDTNQSSFFSPSKDSPSVVTRLDESQHIFTISCFSRHYSPSAVTRLDESFIIQPKRLMLRCYSLHHLATLSLQLIPEDFPVSLLHIWSYHMRHDARDMDELFPCLNSIEDGASETICLATATPGEFVLIPSTFHIFLCLVCNGDIA